MPKMMNMMQFNSKQGACPVCYIKPESITDSGRVKNVFKYKAIFEKRNQDEFESCFNSTTVYQSINGVKKGKPFLNYFINFPDQVLLDYMHVCVRGPQERLLYIWFNSKNRQENYYLGNEI